MTYAAPQTFTTGQVVTADDLNRDIRDNILSLSTHAHTTAAGDGSNSVGPLAKVILTTGAAPAAPGAGLAELYALTGDRPGWRGGVAAGEELAVKSTTELLRQIAISFFIDGGGAVITTGVKGFLYIPFACTITGWTLLGNASGSIVIDVWKDTYANFPPTVADTIAGSEKPTLSAAQKNQDLALSTWTDLTVEAGDVIGFNVDSVATVTRVAVTLQATRAAS